MHSTFRHDRADAGAMKLTRVRRLSQRDFAALDTVSITRGIKIGEARLIALPTTTAFRETPGD